MKKILTVILLYIFAPSGFACDFNKLPFSKSHKEINKFSRLKADSKNKNNFSYKLKGSSLCGSGLRNSLAKIETPNDKLSRVKLMNVGEDLTLKKVFLQNFAGYINKINTGNVTILKMKSTNHPEFSGEYYAKLNDKGKWIEKISIESKKMNVNFSKADELLEQESD